MNGMNTTAAHHPIFDDCKARAGMGFRYAIETTWATDGWLYATDSRICVRAKTDEADTIGKFPPTTKLFIDKWRDTPLKLPVMVEPKVTKCDDCGGTGFFSTCPRCEGTGSVECSEGHDHDCGACNGSGKDKSGKPIQCDSCEDGKIYEWPVFDFGVVALGGKYVSIMLKHGCRVFAWDGKNAANKPVRFEFDGGEGLLMPVNLAENRSDGAIVEVPQ